jgi:nicotinate phosphoribosyltransferase
LIFKAYAYWKLGKHEEPAVFDLYFRKCPFGGEFAVFAGLQSALEFLSTYKFSQDEIDYLRQNLPHADPSFFSWLDSVDCSSVKVYAMKEGSVCFPSVPLLRVEGPLAICQLLETTLLNLINFSSLVCTNAARYRLAAGPTKRMLEFGLRRAQGPDGAMTASRYCYMGGFDATSNVKAGQMFDIAIAVRPFHFLLPFRLPILKSLFREPTRTPSFVLFLVWET